MSFPKAPMFDVRYDWDTGGWELIVHVQYDLEFRRGGYELEEDAEKAKAELMHRLASAPNGDVMSVLITWEKGE